MEVTEAAMVVTAEEKEAAVARATVEEAARVVEEDANSHEDSLMAHEDHQIGEALVTPQASVPAAVHEDQMAGQEWAGLLDGVHEAHQGG